MATADASGSPRRPAGSVRRRAAPGLALLLVLATAACGSSTPTPPPSASGASALPTGVAPTLAGSASAPAASASPDAAIYAAIEQDVETLRGLRASQPVIPQLIDSAGLTAYVDRSLASISPTWLAASGALDHALGLLPDGASLGDLFKELFSTQAAGFYDSDTKKLYVVSKQGGLGPVEKVTFAHEFTHALQDQNFSTFRTNEFQGAASGIVREPDGNSDRSLALLALVEGDPSLVMTYWAQAHLGPADMIALLAASSDPATQKILTGMPALLRDTLLFPYLGGVQFVMGRQLAGGWPAVDRLYANPPTSTEQILHPEKYGVDEPLTVTLPGTLLSRLGAGWSTSVRDTLGELQLRIWLEAGLGQAERATADAAAGGWDGDRVELLTGPGGAWAVVLRTLWDTPADAARFAPAARTTVDALGRTGAVKTVGKLEVDVLLADGSTTLARLSKAFAAGG